MFGRKEGQPLLGVFSRAWAFEPTPPATCIKNPGIRCGVLETRLSRKLQKFLEISGSKRSLLKMMLATYDTYDESRANIAIEVDGASAVFVVKTQKIHGEGERAEGLKRAMRVERNFSDGTGEIEPFAERYRVYLEALKEVMTLWDKTFSQADQSLLCRTCTPQINGLPRPVV